MDARVLTCVLVAVIKMVITSASYRQLNDHWFAPTITSLAGPDPLREHHEFNIALSIIYRTFFGKAFAKDN